MIYLIIFMLLIFVFVIANFIFNYKTLEKIKIDFYNLKTQLESTIKLISTNERNSSKKEVFDTMNSSVDLEKNTINTTIQDLQKEKEIIKDSIKVDLMKNEIVIDKDLLEKEKKDKESTKNETVPYKVDISESTEIKVEDSIKDTVDEKVESKVEEIKSSEGSAPNVTKDSTESTSETKVERKPKRRNKKKPNK